jgi:hypothetical protein
MMQMLEILRTYVKSLLLEQEEREQSEEQEIKELFQRWIDEYSASYLIHRKKVNPDSWDVTQMSIKEYYNFTFISLNFEEYERDDWFIIAFNKEDKTICHTNIPTFVSALALASAYHVEREWSNKVSVEQFRRVMQVTKGNYAQFEVLTKRLSEKNE